MTGDSFGAIGDRSDKSRPPGDSFDDTFVTCGSDTKVTKVSLLRLYLLFLSFSRGKEEKRKYINSACKLPLLPRRGGWGPGAPD